MDLLLTWRIVLARVALVSAAVSSVATDLGGVVIICGHSLTRIAIDTVNDDEYSWHAIGIARQLREVSFLIYDFHAFYLRLYSIILSRYLEKQR